jgi:hypothetical protein
MQMLGLGHLMLTGKDHLLKQPALTAVPPPPELPLGLLQRSLVVLRLQAAVGHPHHLGVACAPPARHRHTIVWSAHSSEDHAMHTCIWGTQAGPVQCKPVAVHAAVPGAAGCTRSSMQPGPHLLSASLASLLRTSSPMSCWALPPCCSTQACDRTLRAVGRSCGLSASMDSTSCCTP